MTVLIPGTDVVSMATSPAAADVRPHSSVDENDTDDDDQDGSDRQQSAETD